MNGSVNEWSKSEWSERKQSENEWSEKKQSESEWSERKQSESKNKWRESKSCYSGVLSLSMRAMTAISAVWTALVNLSSIKSWTG